MKIKFVYLVVIAVLFFVIFTALGKSCCNYKGYNKNTLFPKQYPYEGFQGLQFSEYHGGEEQPSEEQPQEQPQEEENPMTSSVPVEGFQGLQATPYTDPVAIDIYSEAKGNVSCEASTYSNSKGYLCLDEKQKFLLKTRGGNSTGGESQIGV